MTPVYKIIFTILVFIVAVLTGMINARRKRDPFS
jgi:hypothetical protein